MKPSGTWSAYEKWRMGSDTDIETLTAENARLSGLAANEVLRTARLSADNAMLRDTLETICNELQVWNSGGNHRSATWPESRIKRIRAALAKGD